MPSRTVERLCPTFLAIALGYSIFQYGGVVLADWNVCLLLVGLAAVVYWSRTPGDGPASSSDLRRWAVLLVPCYVALQLLPAPLFLLRILSPARARTLDSLGNVMQSVGFAPLSVTPATTSSHLFRIVGYTLTFLIIRDIARRSSERRPWLPAIPVIGFATIEAAWGFLQSAGGDEVQGTYPSRNHFAGLLEMALPLAVAYGIALLRYGRARHAAPASRTVKAGALLAIAALIFGGLLYSLSKMGFVSGLGGLFVMGVLAVTTRLRTWQKWLALASMAAFVIFVFLFLPPDELVGRFGGLSSNDSSEGRWPIWLDTLRLIAAYPVFGCGLGTYGTAFLKYQTSVVDRVFTFAHNDYLQLTAELGTAGFLLLCAVALPVFTRAFRAAAQARDTNTRYLGLGCAGAFAAIGLHSLADFNLYIPANAMVLAWISGIAASLALPLDAAGRCRHRPLFTKFAIALGCLLIVYPSAWILFESEFRSDLQAESIFCRFGICDTDAVVTRQALDHGGKVAGVSPPVLLKALRRDPNEPNRWCDAGAAMLQVGHSAAAEYCFSEALALGPNIPPILMKVGDFYYSLRHTNRSLEQRSHILKETDAYDAAIFDWYTDRKIPVSEVLAHGLPSGGRAAEAYLRYLMNGDHATDAVDVWKWDVLHGYADDRLARDYVNYLASNQKYEDAARTWESYLGPRREGYLESNWVFNGDFEFELSTLALDWRIDQRDDVEVARDASIANTGSHSLRIRFESKGNINYGQIAQRAFVAPGRYRFEACIRTQEITTDQGIGFHIFDPEAPNRVDVSTERLTGTNDWTRIERIILVPTQTKIIQIQVIRQPSLKFDNNISGTAWIDSVKLSPAGKLGPV
jgi:O-antigen ligase